MTVKELFFYMKMLWFTHNHVVISLISQISSLIIRQSRNIFYYIYSLSWRHSYRITIKFQQFRIPLKSTNFFLFFSLARLKTPNIFRLIQILVKKYVFFFSRWDQSNIFYFLGKSLFRKKMNDSRKGIIRFRASFIQIQ